MGSLAVLGLMVLTLSGAAILAWRREVKRDRDLANRFNAAVDKILREE